MNRELVASVVTSLLPLALIALTALAARAASVAVRYIHDRRLALAVELAAYGAAGVVADLMQHVVRDLKDPAKPGAGQADPGGAGGRPRRAGDAGRTHRAPRPYRRADELTQPGQPQTLSTPPCSPRRLNV